MIIMMPSSRCILEAEKIWEEPLEGIEEDKFITHTAAYYYDIFAEQTPEIHMWVTDYCHIMQNHEQILDFLRGAAFTPYQSRLNKEEMQTFADEVLVRIKQVKLGIFIANPAYRDKGIGKHAIQQMISLAKSDGINVITLNVRVGNMRARKVYAACGFKEEKRFKKESGMGAPAVVCLTALL